MMVSKWWHNINLWVNNTFSGFFIWKLNNKYETNSYRSIYITASCPSVSWSGLFNVKVKMVWVNTGCMTHCDVAAHRDSSAPEKFFFLCKTPHQSKWQDSLYTINTFAHVMAKQYILLEKMSKSKLPSSHHLRSTLRDTLLLVNCCNT